MSRLLGDDAARTAMAEASRACGKPGAARDVAADLLALARVEVRRASTNGASTNGTSSGPLRHREAH
jgi:hypothetical protein